MNKDRDQILSPREVESLIAEGQIIVIFEDLVLRLDSWVDKHPGGRLAMLHMVGRDATDEIKAYHTAQTLRSVKYYRIGRKEGLWVNQLPPIRGGVFHKMEDIPIIELENYDSDTSADIKSTSSLDDALSQVSSEYIGAEPIEHKDTSATSSAIDTGSNAKPPTTNGRKRSPSMIAKIADAAILQEVLRDAETYPSFDIETQQEITRKYQLLHQRVQDSGLYECAYIEYGKEMVRYSILFALFFTALRYEWYMTSAFFLGCFWHQIMFTAHDAGHRAITKKFEIDTLIGMFVADFCCGLSIGWWKSSHNVHHLVTNAPEHDPDIQNVPIFATCPSFFKSLRSSYYDFTFVWDAVADFLVPYQAYAYYPVMGIARFNLYLLSWLHVLSSGPCSLSNSKAWWIRPTEILFMSCYWYIFGYLLLWCTLPTWTIRVAFVLVSHIVTMPLHVQITLSHWGMSTVELGETESFPQRQLRTTMDVDCPAWFDFYHGGLQFQAIHHLFPRVPRHNLRKVQAMVREFCADTGIPYSILTFTDGNKKVLGRLKDVSNQLQIMVDCQKHMVKTGESGLH